MAGGGPLVARIYWSSASIIANQISMEGGGPGLGPAPQYEEQLLHTQVEHLEPGVTFR